MVVVATSVRVGAEWPARLVDSCRSLQVGSRMLLLERFGLFLVKWCWRKYEKVVFLLIYSSSSYHVGSTVFTYTNCKPQCEEFRDNQDTKSIKLFFFQNNWNFDKTIEVQSFNTKVEASTRVYVLKRDFM